MATRGGLSPWVLVGGGLVAAGALAALASPKGREAAAGALAEASTAADQVAQAAAGALAEGRQAISHSAEGAMEWWEKVIGRVSRHEGGLDAVNLNRDGAGLSFGMLQWAQKPGSLGELLHAMYKAEPQVFMATFGPASADLLRITGAGSLAAVDGAVLWAEPWVSRFRAAGREPRLQAVQLRQAKEGPYFQAALASARELGFVTERSVALMMDTAVQQGPGFAKTLAKRVRARYAGQRIPMGTMLETFARLAPAHFQRTAPPTEPYPVAHIAWKQVGPSTWHAAAGSFDLYEDVLRRRLSIVHDPQLGDALLEGGPAAAAA